MVIWLYLAAYVSPGVCGGPGGIVNMVNTERAAPSGGCERRYHQRAKYFSDSQALEPALNLTLRKSSWLQTEKDSDEGHKHKGKAKPADDEEEGKDGGKECQENKAADPASFFPDLFHKAFKLTEKAIRLLNKCLQIMDDIKGDIDSLPHDEKQMPVLSAQVKIEVGNKELSIQEIVKDFREAVSKIQNLADYLSSAKSQVNAKLRQVLPHPAEQ